MVTALVAAAAPPNTWDSMTYHMSRVAHWQQQASVANYPTHILRQLHQAPWSEFAILNLQILTGGDQLANFVQWTSMLGAILGTSLIARQLGGEVPAQLLAAIFAATLPIGVLESSSTQTDYVLAFWLVCFVAFALRFILDPQKPLGRAETLGMGASLGLAVLTKATGYLFVAPFLLWVGAALLRSLGRGAWQPLLAVLLVALALNSGYFARNIRTYGSPLGPGREDPPGAIYLNGLFTPSAFVSNLVRNLALQVVTPSREVNAAIDRVVRGVHRQLGANVSDPRTTWQQIPNQAFYVPILGFDEDSTGNPLHLLLLMAALVVAVAASRGRSSRPLLAYGAATVAAALLFALMLRWQPWNSRLQLPLFVLGAPFVAVALGKLPRGWPPALGVILVVTAIPWVLWSNSRPLVGEHSVLFVSRATQYFRNSPTLEEGYVGAARTIAETGCGNVGLLADWNDWEYPLWVVLREQGATGVRIEHVQVDNVSGALPRAPFEPCAIVALPDVDRTSIPAGWEDATGLPTDAVRVLVPNASRP